MSISQKNLEKLQAVRDPKEINMVFITGLHLENTVSPSAAENFSNDPYIKLVESSEEGVQQITINRYFGNKLLIFRASNEVDITDVILALVNDASAEDWFTLFRTIVIPFINKYRIL